MEVQVASDLATLAADRLEVAIGEAIAKRGRCVLALSGGRSPWAALKLLARREISWDRLDIVQVDEREAPDGHDDRNLTGLRASLPKQARVHAMPVEAGDGDARYADQLVALCGTHAILDVVHLGLGDDGHTASLVPGDPALEARTLVAWTRPYQGRRRLTLTFPVLDRARLVLWLVSGSKKRPMVRRLLDHDRTIPAGRVRARKQVILCDEDALPELP